MRIARPPVLSASLAATVCQSLLLAQAHGDSGRPPATAAACFAPGTSSDYVARIEWALHGGQVPGPVAQPIDRWPAPAGSGRLLTYSFPADGLSLPAQFAGDRSGSNSLNAAMTARFGSAAAGQAFFRSMFDQWSLVTDLTFAEVADDNAPWPNSPGNASRGDLRLVARPIDGTGNTVAFNKYPSFGGDMLVDVEDFPRLAQAVLFETLMHEVGHGIGLAHVCPRTVTKVMEPIVFAAGSLLVDDARGGQELYGDRFEPNDSRGAATSLMSLGASPRAPLTLRWLGLQSGSDQDWFSLETCPQDTVTVQATPVGGTYSQGPYTSACDTGSSVNANAIENLALEFVYPTNLRAIIDNAPIGAAESHTFSASGRTDFRVYSTGSSGERVQLYELRVSINRANSAVFYVSASATGQNNGSSWSDAFRELHQALAAAQGGCGGTNEIWVARGSYRPTTPGIGQLPDLGVSFVVRDGVRIYGGFAGTETERSQRDVANNPTVLTGVYPHPILLLVANHVVTMTGVGATTTIDGCTITGGGAGGSSPDGGAVLLQNASPTLRNCVLGGYATGRGGAVASLGSGRPVFEDCRIAGGDPLPRQSPTQAGGGLFAESGARCTRCRFAGSLAGRGAAIMLAGGSLEIEDCTFADNDATVSGASSGQGYGGGAVCASGGTVVLRTSTFTRNRGIDGGALLGRSATFDVERCRFEGNQATGRGGAVAFDSGSAHLAGIELLSNSADFGGGLAVGSATVSLLASTLARNEGRTGAGGVNLASGAQLDVGGCILWANTVGLLRGGEAVQLAFAGSPPRVDFTCLEGWTGNLGGTGNFGADPRLADLLAGDLHLTAASPCIDAFTAPPPLPAFDLDGQPRRLCAHEDLGADEFGEPFARIFGTSCAGDLDLAGAPRVGSTYAVHGWTPGGNGMLFIGSSATIWGGIVPLPFDMSLFGATGCLVWVAPEIELYRGPVSQSPFAPTVVPISVPNLPVLACRTFYHQWFFWLPTQPLSQFRSSQAAEVRVGF